MFIGIPIPDAIRSGLVDALIPYRKAFPDVRWTRPGSWHVTLLFLGSVELQRVVELIDIVDVRASGTVCFGLASGRHGGSVSRGGGVAWLGLSKGDSEVVGLANELALACPDDMATGRSRPRRTPSPHLTVARRVDGQVIAALREERFGPLGLDWTADRISLFRSHLGEGSSVYETLHETPLASRA